MSSTQYDLTFPRNVCFFVRTLLFPLFVMKNIKILKFSSKFFTQELEQIREITDFDELWTVRFHVFLQYCIFIKNAPVPSVCDRKESWFLYFKVFFHIKVE